MGRTGRLYPPDFKEDAVRLVHASDERWPIRKIARDLGVSLETLRKKWVKQTEVGARTSFKAPKNLPNPQR